MNESCLELENVDYSKLTTRILEVSNHASNVELAEVMGISPSQAGRKLKGEAQFKDFELFRIAKKYSCTVDYLLGLSNTVSQRNLMVSTKMSASDICRAFVGINNTIGTVLHVKVDGIGFSPDWMQNGDDPYYDISIHGREELGTNEITNACYNNEPLPKMDAKKKETCSIFFAVCDFIGTYTAMKYGLTKVGEDERASIMESLYRDADKKVAFFSDVIEMLPESIKRAVLKKRHDGGPDSQE